MKQCLQCHRVYGNEAAFCLEDGSPLTDTRDSEQTVVKTAYLSTPTTAIAPAKKNRTILWLIVIVVVAAALVVGGLLLGMNLSTSHETAASSPPAATPTSSPISTPLPTRTRTPRPTPVQTPDEASTINTPALPEVHTVQIINNSFNLNPGAYISYAISVPSRKVGKV